jgi:hypothetical protein
MKSMIVLDFLEPGQTINSDSYIATLTKLETRISRATFSVIAAVRKWVTFAGSDFYEHNMQALVIAGENA